MTESGVWWLLAGAMVVAELVTGTFYLLMMAVGLVAGALTAHAGFGLTAQILVSALVGGGGVAVWHFKRSQQPKPADASANPDVNLDIGALVTVTEWLPDGTTQVKFRGALWSAVASRGTDHTNPGVYTITEVHGNRLTLSQTGIRASQQISTGDGVA